MQNALKESGKLRKNRRFSGETESAIKSETRAITPKRQSMNAMQKKQKKKLCRGVDIIVFHSIIRETNDPFSVKSIQLIFLPINIQFFVKISTL